MVKLFRDLIKQPKSANDSATSQSNSTRVSVSSAFGVRDSVPVNDAGSVKSTASSKYIDFYLSVIDDDDDLASLDPTASLHSARPPPSSVPDLLNSAMGQGEL